MSITGLSLDEYITRVKQNKIVKHQGDIFEKSSLIFLRNFRKEYEYYLYNNFSIQDKIYFGLPPTDKGVDIVGIDRSNKKIILVQCKYTSDKNKVLLYGKDKLSHTIAMKALVLEQNNGWSVNTMVITTGKGINVPDRNMQLISGNELHGKISIIMEAKSMDLRPYQRDIIDKMEKHFIVNNKRVGRLVMATGTGKTFTILKYIEKNILNLRDPKVLIVTNSKLLAKQTYDIFNSALSKNVASDFSQVLLISQDGIRDADVIAKSQEKIHISTYESMNIPIENCKYNLVIFDESHHSDSDIKKLLIDKIDKTNGKILYMTATERNDTSSTNISEHIARYSIGDGIKNGYLSDYRINIYRTKIDGDYKNIDKDSLKKYRYKSIILGMIDKISDGEFTKIIVFCKDQKSAKIFRDLLREELLNKNLGIDIYFDLLISDDNKNRKNEIRKKFIETDIGIIINVRMLVEGIDIPEIDTIVFADNSSSKINTIQAIGRSLRISPGKKYSNICVSVYTTDSKNNDSLLLLEKQQKKLNNFIQFLKDEDSTYLEYTPDYIGKFKIINTDLTPKKEKTNTLSKNKPRLSEIDSVNVKTPHIDIYNSDLILMTDIINLWNKSTEKQKLLIELQKKDRVWSKYLKIWTWVLHNKTYPKYFRIPYDQSVDTVFDQEKNDSLIYKAKKFASSLENIIAKDSPFDRVFVKSLSCLVVHQNPRIWKNMIDNHSEKIYNLSITAEYQKILLDLFRNTQWLNGKYNISPPNGTVDLTVFLFSGLKILGDMDKTTELYISSMKNLITTSFKNITEYRKNLIKNTVSESGTCDFIELLNILNDIPDINKIWTIYHFTTIPEKVRVIYQKITKYYGLDILSLCII